MLRNYRLNHAYFFYFMEFFSFHFVSLNNCFSLFLCSFCLFPAGCSFFRLPGAAIQNVSVDGQNFATIRVYKERKYYKRIPRKRFRVTVAWGKRFKKRFAPKASVCRRKRLIHSPWLDAFCEGLRYSSMVVSLFAFSPLCTLLFGLLLCEVCVLRLLGVQWRQRLYCLAVMSLDAFVISHVMQGKFSFFFGF